MNLRVVIKKSLSLVLYLVIFMGLLFFLIQQINLIKDYKSLEKENKKLIENNMSYRADILKIIFNNTTLQLIETDVAFRSDKIYLCVDYPVCSSCFVNVNHFLNAYAKMNNKELILLCGTKYIREAEKILKFENLEQVEVDALIDMHSLDAKMIVVFNSSKNKQFYLPLPKKHEVDFLKAFLQ